MLTVASVVDHLESLMPTRLAADWDNVGLLLGDRNAPVQRVMTCLTVTEESAQESVERRADLILTHHPVLFRGAKRLTTDTSEGRILLSLLRAGVAVYCPHTAFDNAGTGINESLARKLDLVEIAPLRACAASKQIKLVVFVPDSDLQKVSDALFKAGAGRIGEYSECSFRLQGTGTFHGSEASNPTLGQKGRREEVNEWRLEVVCPENRIRGIVEAMRKAHSYEEPAFDLYPLTSVSGKEGEGRIGKLPTLTTLGELAKKVRAITKSGPVQVVGGIERKVQKIAIVCGAGGELLGDAIRARAEVFLTGEARFHDYLHTQSHNMAMILPGHYATERGGVEELAERVAGQFSELEVWASQQERDPVQWI